LLDATDAHRIEAEVRVLWDPVRRHRLTVGAEVQHHYRADYRTWDAGVASYNADFPFTQVIVSVQDEVAVAPWLRLVGGVSHSFHTDGADAATPRAAVLLYPDSATTVKLLYGEGFRAPSAYERRYGEAASDWEVNPDLRPERLRTGEVVVERRLSSVLHAGASAFVNVITGMIDPVEEGDPPVGRFINAQSVTALGAELELTARGPGIMVRGSYAFHHATDNTTDERVSNAPLHLLRLSSAASAWNLGTIAGEVRLDAGRRTIAGAAVPVVANVDLGVTSRSLMGGLRAGVRVTNLLDRANVVPAGVEHRQQVLPQARRQLIVSLTWTP
jgi:iron complex outermembrane receptor protein